MRDGYTNIQENGAPGCANAHDMPLKDERGSKRK